MERVFERIIAFLDAHTIVYDLYEHEPVRTSEEAAKVRGVSLNAGIKSMVVKGNDVYALFILPASKHIDWKKVREILHAKKVRFATEEEAEMITQVKMGSVPPFPDILGIPGYYDTYVFDEEYLFFNPGSVTHTIRIRGGDFKKLLDVETYEISRN